MLVIIFLVCYILLVILLFYLFNLPDYIRQFFVSLWVLLFCFITYVAVYLIKNPGNFVEVVKNLFFMYLCICSVYVYKINFTNDECEMQKTDSLKRR